MLFNKIKKNKGFTLVETLVGVAVFLIIATASYQAYISLFSLINANQYKILALNLANEQFEIIRNLPYADVGIQSGIPNGKIPRTQNITRGNVNFTVITTIKNVDLPFDGQIGSSTRPDLSPADNKLVEVEIDCDSCKGYNPVTLTTTVAPKNLETASTNGAILIKVFDANGVPVAGADVHIVNSKVTPNIIIDDTTDNNGLLQVVDAPPGTEAYKITVSKDGYSTDMTYTPGQSGNPTPTKPDATVVIQQLTQISFSIDKLSSLSFSSVTPECTPVGNIDFSLKGSKIIGTNVYKYLVNQTTNSSGTLTNNSMEWDSYTVTGIDSAYDIIGVSPLNPIGLNPNSTQNVSLVVASKNPNSLLVTVKDSATKLPITDAYVKVTGGTYNTTKITGRGFINQTDWSSNNYNDSDGNIDTESPQGEIKLKNVFGSYNPSGWLESKTIDTGSISNFYNLIWLPTDQPVNSGPNSVKLQFATNASSTDNTWIYKGPDGATTTYYLSSDSPIYTGHNGDRYVRYKAFLNTQNSTSTPNVSDVSFTVTTSCTPPGQVVFSGLSNNTYQIEVSKTGYSTATVNATVNSPWQEKEVLLIP